MPGCAIAPAAPAPRPVGSVSGSGHDAVQREVAAERRLRSRANRMPTGCCAHAPGAQFLQLSCPCSGLNSGLPSIQFPIDTTWSASVAPDTSTATDADALRRPGRHRTPGRPAAGRPRRHRQGHLWPAGCHRSNAGCAPVGRPPAADRRARPRQDQAGRDPGRRARHGRQAHPVHARPDAGRHPGLRGAGGERRRPPLLPLHPGPGVRPAADGRRNQPRQPAHPVGAAAVACRRRTSPSPASATTCRRPFHVLATQNPLEQEGTYPLPEAQLDRFLLQIDVGYPDEAAERQIMIGTTGATTCRSPRRR